MYVNPYKKYKNDATLQASHDTKVTKQIVIYLVPLD